MRAIKRSAGGVLAFMAVLSGCSDGGPSAPPTRVAAAVESASGETVQTAYAGDIVPAAPTVLVRDRNGEPLGGTKVSFVVTQGGGSVDSASATTNASGIASAGQWTLGTSAGANVVEARLGTLPAVEFTAVSIERPAPPAPPTQAPPPGSFDIMVRYLTTPTLRQRQAVTAAVTRWRTAIVGDLPDIPLTAAAGTCTASQPALNELVDDLLLLIDFADIDGPGKTLGQAGPCYVRTGSYVPIVGVLKLDSADLALMETNGTLDDVVLHEIGHVLGIGTLWKNVGLLTGAGTPDPYFTGANALSAYRGMGGLTVGVPVENSGADGTREGHWREAVFGNELMTGWITVGPNPLSGMTIASLQDMGYGASLAAAGTYTFSGGGQGLQAGVDLRGREKIHGPKYKVDRSGKKERID